MIVIETKRLTLEQLTKKDQFFMFELLNTPKWIKYISNKKLDTIEQAEKYLSAIIDSYSTNGFGLYLVKRKTDQSKMGICGLVNRKSLADVDIGFGFLPEFEKMGYGFEAAKACLDYGKNDLGLTKICAITVSYNDASIGLLEKLGLTFVKNIRLKADDEELMLFETG